MISTILMMAMTTVGGHKGCCKTTCSSACYGGSCYSACSGYTCNGGGCYSGCYSSCSGKSSCCGKVKKAKKCHGGNGCSGCYSSCSGSCTSYYGCTACTSGCVNQSGCAHGATPAAPAPTQVKKAPDGKAMAPVPSEFRTVGHTVATLTYASEPVVVYAE